MLIDSHCHLNYEGLKDRTDEILQRARAVGVSKFLTICTKLEDFPEIKNIIQNNSDIYGSFGIHPHDADKYQHLTLNDIIKYAEEEKIIGIGETGLDFYYDHSDRAVQEQMFIRHINAAQNLQKPIIVHTRDADARTMEILEAEYKNQNFPGLIHCFSTSKELANRALDIGFYISISGIITFNKASELREIVKEIPLDRLLIETDSPFLAPVPHRGKTNEPAFVKEVAHALANLKNISFEELAQITSDNFNRLFNL